MALAPGGGAALRYGITLVIVALLVPLHLKVGSDLSWLQLSGLLMGGSDAGFDALRLHLSALPRLVMALMVGMAMGLSGSVLQQLTQNRLVSPMTVGASSGAWLGLVVATLVAPAFAARHGEWVALLGAMASIGLVLLIAGRQGIVGLPVVLAGMAMNLLLGALASGLVLMNNQYARGLFVWGAGDLAQIDWARAEWLWPKLLPGLLLIALAPRALTLMRLGGEGAQARGLNVLPLMLALFLGSLWLTSVSITAVGLIGFIGLLTPNVAQMCGARTSRDELVFSTLLGALLLLLTDALALLAKQWTSNLVPSGAAAALIGAPMLLWLSRRQMAAEDQRGLQLPEGSGRLSPWLLGTAGLGAMAVVFISICLAREMDGWRLEWPSALVWSLRWPRVLTAGAAGAGLAVAGMILQRLLRNPLASPDILGLSAGSTLAVMVAMVLFGGSLLGVMAPIAAFVGALAVLALLLLLGRRHQYAPSLMVLIGISLTALLNAALQFGLAKGTADSFALLGWLAGSTYRATAAQALSLTVGVVLLCGLSLCFHRALTLISIGDGVALSRGLSVPRLRVTLLVLVSLLCALVTALMGPVAFLGLLAPHIAAILGARKVVPQLLISAALGSMLMMLADWIGRTLIFPLQIPVGIVASIICGLYFVFLLVRQRLSS